jgi:hypothetical protein
METLLMACRVGFVCSSCQQRLMLLAAELGKNQRKQQQLLVDRVVEVRMMRFLPLMTSVNLLLLTPTQIDLPLIT